MKYLEEEIGNISIDRRPYYSINVDILIENRLMATRSHLHLIVAFNDMSVKYSSKWNTLWRYFQNYSLQYYKKSADFSSSSSLFIHLFIHWCPWLIKLEWMGRKIFFDTECPTYVPIYKFHGFKCVLLNFLSNLYLYVLHCREEAKIMFYWCQDHISQLWIRSTNSILKFVDEKCLQKYFPMKRWFMPCLESA